MAKNLFFSVFFLFLFISSIQVKASHIIGGELTYDCIGGGKYNITLVIYRECSSYAVLEDYYPLQFYANDLDIHASKPLNVNIYKKSVTEIQLYCSSAITNCNGGTERGVKKVIYQGQVDLGKYGESEDWRLFWRRASRSSGIGTIVAPDQQDFFIEASINNLDGKCNSSPVFNSYAAANVCSGIEQVYNVAANDPEGDQLNFTIESPKVNYNSNVVYSSGYNKEHFMPMQGKAELNKNNGDLTFTPTLGVDGIVDIKVEQFDEEQSLGWVKRAMQFTAEECNTEAPVFTDFIKENTDSLAFCARDTIRLSFEVTDPDNENVVLRQLNGPSVVGINQNGTTNPSGNIFWVPDNSEAGVHYIIMEAKDLSCPKPGVTLKTFIINVLQAPIYSLPEDRSAACYEAFTLDPKVKGGDGNYQYLWNSGDTSPTLYAGIGQYLLKVTDGNGCSTLDSTLIYNELMADFVPLKPFCINEQVDFTNKSLLLNSDKEIVKYYWDFGDGATSTLENPTHTYTQAGAYVVKFTVTDNGSPTCTNTTTRKITICEPPVFDFNLNGICSLMAFDITVFEDVGLCNDLIRITYSFGDGFGVTTEPDSIFYTARHVYQSGGDYEIKVTAVSRNGCVNTVKRMHHINDSPLVQILQEDYYFVCNDPDTLLETNILSGGTGEIEYFWYPGFEETEDLFIDKDGNYTVFATDELGCRTSDAISVRFPLNARMEYDPYCEEGDIVQFYNKSYSMNSEITSYSWNFGDPESSDNTSTEESPSHEFSKEDEFEIEFIVKDDIGCTDTMTHYSGVIVEAFSLHGDITINPALNEFCLNDTATFIMPEFKGEQDFMYWVYNELDTTWNDELLHKRFKKEGNNTIGFNIEYNNNDLTRDGQYCKANFDTNVLVKPLPDLTLKGPDRYCQGDPTEFSYASADVISSVLWTITDVRNSTPPFQSTNDTFTYSFPLRSTYKIDLAATSDLGCVSTRTLVGTSDQVVIPDFVAEEGCAKEPLAFREDFIDTFENVTDYRWDFGDGSALIEGTMPMPLTTHTFQTGGSYNVRFTVINRFSGCEKTKEKTVNILYPPHIDFSFDTICAKSVMIFENKTTKGDAEIAGYQWLFHDGSSQTTKDAAFFYKNSGYFPVSLVATSTIGCTDTLTQYVYVQPSPYARIELPEQFVQAYLPMQFYDASEGNIIDYYWEFGDGHQSNDRDPVHTYSQIEKYPLTHIVTNEYGCKDTAVVKLDLNVYIDFPTAFSPNGDDKNDEFKLIQQGITDVPVYKIYNRHGQVVFDGNGNPKSIWDGKYNGKPQPAGAYVVHVQAEDAYGEKYNMKKNLVLLR